MKLIRVSPKRTDALVGVSGSDLLTRQISTFVSTGVSLCREIFNTTQAMSSRGRANIDSAGGQAYSAAAMSLVFHTASPLVPTFRADVRYLEVGNCLGDRRSGHSLFVFQLSLRRLLLLQSGRDESIESPHVHRKKRLKCATQSRSHHPGVLWAGKPHACMPVE